ncbi:MAG: hypothetical protein KAI67_05735 [Candidatus Pacebacteria bacterium]|nr:hypothetical protein [Candidatus Paceibacterota bacterium]
MPIGKIELTKREKEVLKKCKTPQELSDRDEFVMKQIQSWWRYFTTGFDHDDMIQRTVITKEGKHILKKGYYRGVSIV